MEKVIVIALFLAGLFIAFMGCRSQEPCPVYPQNITQDKEVILDETEV